MVFEKVRDLIVDQFDASADDITADTVIVEDLGADSLDVMDLVNAVEDEFDVEIPEESIDSIKTVGDIVTFIENNATED